jgi:Fe-S-cluster-containing hydrogenase component 2
VWWEGIQGSAHIMKIIRDTEACYGCRTCELVCSFHHKGVFSLGGGSITVKRDNNTGEIKWTIDSTCDSCDGEDQPLCVKYCVYGALGVVK